jgi:hypothetical protein
MFAVDDIDDVIAPAHLPIGYDHFRARFARNIRT